MLNLTNLLLSPRRRFVSTLALTGAALCGSALAAHADDTALVIGINSYNKLGKNAELRGCVRDAMKMEDTLKGMGFKVTLLTDKKAGRKDIEENLKRVSKGVGEKDRFVVYFAGYGVSNVKNGDKEKALLPADADKDKSDNDLPVLSVYKTVDALPCKVKAVILDTSFSGTLLPTDDKKESTLRPRFFLRSSQQKTRLWTQSDPTNADTADASIMNGNTVLFSAAMQTQVAYEQKAGDDRGVFTTALADELKKPGRWQEVQARVTARVASETGSQQTPILLPVSYLYKSVLSTTPAPPGPGDMTIKDFYSMSRPSAAVITLRNDLNKTRLMVAEPVQLKVNVGADGYVLLIGSDAKNRIGLAWPNTNKLADVDSARVTKGPFSFPGTFQSDTPGDDHLKAYWFPLSAKDTVAALMQSIQSGSGDDISQVSLQKSQLGTVLFATSEMHTRIELPGATP